MLQKNNIIEKIFLSRFILDLIIDNNIGNKGCQYLSLLEKNKSLKYLNLSCNLFIHYLDNDIGDEGCEYLKLIDLKNLNELIFNSNFIF